jgi:hypothetical protein
MRYISNYKRFNEEFLNKLLGKDKKEAEKPTEQKSAEKPVVKPAVGPKEFQLFFSGDNNIDYPYVELSDDNQIIDKELNRDKSVSSMFESHGRVRAIRLRGEKSEGYIVPIEVLVDFVNNFLGKKVSKDDIKAGQDFDTVFDHILCKKYVPRNVREPNVSGKKTKGNVKRYETKLVENQFRFHEDTSHLKSEMFKVSPDDYVSITNKLHGCNFIVSHVRVKRKLSLLERLAKKIGIRVEETEYGMLYSSRAVIKNPELL